VLEERAHHGELEGDGSRALPLRTESVSPAQQVAVRNVGRVLHPIEAEEVQESAAIGSARLLGSGLVDEGGSRARVKPPAGDFPAAGDLRDQGFSRQGSKPLRVDLASKIKVNHAPTCHPESKIIRKISITRIIVSHCEQGFLIPCPNSISGRETAAKPVLSGPFLSGRGTVFSASEFTTRVLRPHLYTSRRHPNNGDSDSDHLISIRAADHKIKANFSKLA
jgi:hypothetical protein